MSSTTQTAINSRNDSINELENRKGGLQQNLGDVVLLRQFFDVWHSQGLEAAKNSLPKDNPATRDVNEEVTFDHFKKIAVKYYKEPSFEAIQKKMEDPETAKTEKPYYYEEAQKMIRKFLAYINMTDYEIEDNENEIKEITELSKYDTSGGM